MDRYLLFCFSAIKYKNLSPCSRVLHDEKSQQLFICRIAPTNLTTLEHENSLARRAIFPPQVRHEDACGEENNHFRTAGSVP